MIIFPTPFKNDHSALTGNSCKAVHPEDNGSVSGAAVSSASRQALTRDSCKSSNTQWKMPSEEKRGREEEVKREWKKEKELREKREKEANDK